MKARVIIFLATMGCLCGGGCMTNTLWHEKDYVVPSPPDPKLVLSQTPRGILAQYDASYERDGTVRRLAYYVEPNMERIAKGRKPVFVDPAQAGPKTDIPILPQAAVGKTKSQLFAVYSANDCAFSIYCRGEEVIGPCGLPVFKDQRQTAAQLALTPLAVTADATIVGAIIGSVWVMGHAEGDGGTATNF